MKDFDFSAKTTEELEERLDYHRWWTYGFGTIVYKVSCRCRNNTRKYYVLAYGFV